MLVYTFQYLLWSQFTAIIYGTDLSLAIDSFVFNIALEVCQYSVICLRTAMHVYKCFITLTTSTFF